MLVSTMIVLVVSSVSTAQSIDNATLQLYHFAQKHPEPIGIMTLSSGAPITKKDASMSLNRRFIHNENLLEILSHVVAETIPNKIVHFKGSGASGYFEVTHDITHICKAKMFAQIGKRTPVRTRFSNALTRVDTDRDIRGFAVKFYTEDGNFDIAGLNIPIFFFSDPLKFSSFFHAFSRNPATSLSNPNALWDYASLNLETLFFLTIMFTDEGTPATHRYMPGFGLHTYQVSNAMNDISFIRFHFIPENIPNTLNATQAAAIAATDIDYHIRDLYNAIYEGNYPQWDVAVQIMTLEDVLNDVRLIDTSRAVPLDKFPLHPVGKLVLDTNPVNYFREVEQIQFVPSNVVPGIKGAPDKVFESRAYAYRLAAVHRLGVNYNKIDVNYPYNTKPLTYYRDGPPPVLDNGGDAPHYYPNSFNGAVPTDAAEPDLIEVVELPPYNGDQVSEYYENLPEDQKTALVQNMGAALSQCTEDVRERVLTKIAEINAGYGARLIAAVAAQL